MKNEGIDIDRLHKVYFGQISDNGCGSTTLFATYLIGVSELPDYNYKNQIHYTIPIYHNAYVDLTVIQDI